MPAEFTCPSCRAVTTGRYCVQCGEKQLESHDRSLRHYLGEALEVLTHFDTKIIRSVGLLLSRPGFLSTEWLQGKRIRYVSPLRLFLLLNIVYYISLTALQSSTVTALTRLEFNTFTTPLAVQLHGNDFYPAYAARQVAEKLRLQALDYADLQQKYDATAAVLSKTLVFALIPVIALLFRSLFIRRKVFFADHLVIATHFWSFVLLLLGVLLPAMVLPLAWISAVQGMSSAVLINDQVVSYVLQVVLAVYIFLMLRRAYLASIWYSGLVAAFIAWSFFFIVWLYRFLLFEVTLAVI